MQQNPCETDNCEQVFFDQSKEAPHFQHLCAKIDLEQFQDHYCQILELVDAAGLMKSTKYITTLYFSRYICHSQFYDFDTLKQIRYASVLAACQTNSDTSGLKNFLENTFTGKSIINNTDVNSLHLIKQRMIQMKLSQSEKKSPYDRLEMACLEFKINDKTKWKIQLILDFCLSLSRLCQINSQKIFWACIITALKLKSSQNEFMKLGSLIPEGLREHCEEIGNYAHYQFIQNMDEQLQ